MFKAIPWLLVGAGLVAMPTYLNATTEVVVNLNVKHSVEGKDKFERRNHIKLHSTLSDNDWNGEEDKLKYMMEDLDVYFGRDNGVTSWNFNQANEDADNPGYADPNHIIQRGKTARENVWGVNKVGVHKYDGRGDLMIGGQPRPHFLGQTSPCCGGESWQANGADAAGDFLGQLVNEFFRKAGQPVTDGPLAPIHFEVLNEPLYQVTDAPHELGLEEPLPPLEIFEFHNEVADAFRQHNTDIKIGGFTVAFPIFEERNFARWEERMKMFIDTSGEHMDFYSTHFYDLEDDNRFKGSRIEATLDMIDNYSLIKLGEKKEHVISEYGGRNRPIESQPWSALRDWWFLKTASPMLLQFMDRPDSISTSIPFVPIKALWGTSANGIPYNWRLLRQRKEAPGETGDDWVFTEMVKFYELWSDVNGTRVDSFSTNSDILIDSYVEQDKAYVVISNLTEQAEKIILHKYGIADTNIESVKVKHLYLGGSAPVLDVINLSEDMTEFDIAPEATLVIEYNYTSDITIDELSEEKKYYATEYLKPISKDVANSFTIENVTTNEMGENILRIAVGRELGKSLTPTVTFNGQVLHTPAEISGDEQNTRGSFFGVLEIPVPNDLLSSSNTISVTFADDGGQIASVNMKAFGFSADIRPDGGPVEGILIQPEASVLPVGSTMQITATVTPFFATDQTFSLKSDKPAVATVDDSGQVLGISAGEVTITATSTDGQFEAHATITVEDPVVAAFSFDDASIYTSTTYKVGGVMTVTTNYEAGTGLEVSSDFGGIDYFLRQMSSDFIVVIKDIKVRDGSAIGQQRGTSVVEIPLDGTIPTADLQNGEFYFLFVAFKNSAGEEKRIQAFPINIEKSDVVVEPSLQLDNPLTYRDTVYSTSDTLDVIANFEAGEGNTVSNVTGGVRFFLRELDASFGLVNDNIIEDASAIDTQSGTANASFSLSGLTPSSELPDGNFYYLFATFIASDGIQYSIDGVFPITIEQGVIEPSFTFDDASIYSTTEYKVGGTMNVSVNYEVGTGNTVSNGVGGVRFFLRHLKPGLVVEKDIIIEDASAIGQQSGTASVSIPLSGVTPTSELPAGDFYSLFVLVESSDGTRTDVAVQNINIVNDQVRGDLDGDGVLDQGDLSLFRTALGSSQGDANFNAAADMDNDGIVTRSDYRLLVIAYRNQ